MSHVSWTDQLDLLIRSALRTTEAQHKLATICRIAHAAADHLHRLAKVRLAQHRLHLGRRYIALAPHIILTGSRVERAVGY